MTLKFEDLELESEDQTSEEQVDTQDGSEQQVPDGSTESQGAEDSSEGKDTNTQSQEEVSEGKDVEAQNQQQSNEVAILRQTVRELKSKVALAEAREKSRTATVNKQKKSEADKLFDEISGEDKEVEVTETVKSDLEILDDKLNNIFTDYGHHYRIQLDTMAMNSDYKDVKSVCTNERLGDIIEVAAMTKAAETGKDISVIEKELELSIWEQPNPWLYMYGLIKKYHPDFAEKAPSKPPTQKPKDKEPVKVPGSVAGASESGGEGGWTRQKIDEMHELELGKVPSDIYQKYLLGELN